MGRWLRAWTQPCLAHNEHSTNIDYYYRALPNYIPTFIASFSKYLMSIYCVPNCDRVMHQREVGPQRIYGLEMEAEEKYQAPAGWGDLPCGEQVGRPW